MWRVEKRWRELEFGVQLDVLCANFDDILLFLFRLIF
jgi:hypothetical protein